MRKQQYRQGHILLDPQKIPNSATRVQPEIPAHVVLARGETGREHVFRSQRVEIYQMTSDLYIEVKASNPDIDPEDDSVLLEHPEHGHIEVYPGTYRLIEQIELEAPSQSPRRSYD